VTAAYVVPVTCHSCKMTAEQWHAGECEREVCWMSEHVQPLPAPRDPLLVARQRTHGDFRSNAEISQRIKKIFRDNTVTVSPGTSNVHLEALDMIALKLSRILSGQADYADHWRDVAGYAKLAEEACSPITKQRG